MFISVTQLKNQMGVDPLIGKFFVDRKPPQNNSFWKGKLLYIGFGNGYVSIPVYYELLHRIGVPIEKLLEEKHVLFMEQLMHFAVLQEKNEIPKKEELSSIRALLKGRIKNEEYFQKLNDYLDQSELKPLGPFGLKHASLNRADVFLYVLCDLPLTPMQWGAAIRYWYALHPSYLIIDDVRDYAKDLEEKQENVVIDLGAGAEGFEKTFDLLRANAVLMQEVNPDLGHYLLEYEEILRKYVPAKF